jgi:hypothetical protein
VNSGFLMRVLRSLLQQKSALKNPRKRASVFGFGLVGPTSGITDCKEVNLFLTDSHFWKEAELAPAEKRIKKPKKTRSGFRV